MADVYHPDTRQLLPNAPRNMMKEALKTFTKDNNKGICTQIQFSFVMRKLQKEEKEEHPHLQFNPANNGLLSID